MTTPSPPSQEPRARIIPYISSESDGRTAPDLIRRVHVAGPRTGRPQRAQPQCRGIALLEPRAVFVRTARRGEAAFWARRAQGEAGCVVERHLRCTCTCSAHAVHMQCIELGSGIEAVIFAV